LKCFNQSVCPYNPKKDEFCSGNGFCDFENGKCKCDREYGSFDCSKPFIQFEISGFISVPLIVLSTIFLIISLALMVWVHLYRDVGDVKAMSVVFTHLTLVGCASVCCGNIVIGVGFNEANCVILEWFQFLGICIVIACALLKAYRIASIFGASNFSPSDLTDSVLLKYFLIMVVVDVLFLGIYTAFNFVEGGAYSRYLDDELLKQTRCSSQPLTMLSYSLLVAWQLVLLLFVLKYGNQTRSASKIFKETKCIYVGSNIGAILFIAFGIFVLFTTNLTLQVVIRGYGSLIVVIMAICLLFYPKFKAVYQLKKGNEQILEDEHGNKMTEDEMNLKRQYEANVKDPNGKELLLLLDALVRELSYRVDMKMLSIELKSIDLLRCLKLLDDVKDLIPISMQEQYLKEQEIKKQQQMQQQDEETTQMIVTKEENKGNMINMTNMDDIKPESIQQQQSKSKTRDKADSLASDSHNVQSDNEDNKTNGQPPPMYMVNSNEHDDGNDGNDGN